MKACLYKPSVAKIFKKLILMIMVRMQGTCSMPHRCLSILSRSLLFSNAHHQKDFCVLAGAKCLCLPLTSEGCQIHNLVQTEFLEAQKALSKDFRRKKNDMTEYVEASVSFKVMSKQRSNTPEGKK